MYISTFPLDSSPRRGQWYPSSPLCTISTPRLQTPSHRRTPQANNAKKEPPIRQQTRPRSVPGLPRHDVHRRRPARHHGRQMVMAVNLGRVPNRVLLRDVDGRLGPRTTPSGSSPRPSSTGSQSRRRFPLSSPGPGPACDSRRLSAGGWTKPNAMMRGSVPCPPRPPASPPPYAYPPRSPISSRSGRSWGPANPPCPRCSPQRSAVS